MYVSVYTLWATFYRIVHFHSFLAAAGSQVLDWFVGGPSVKMALKLNTFDWSCNAKQSLCELGPELQHWSNVVSVMMT